MSKKVYWASLKSEIDKLDIGKLETTPVDLSKLKNFVKKTEYDELLKISTLLRLLVLVI